MSARPARVAMKHNVTAMIDRAWSANGRPGRRRMPARHWNDLERVLIRDADLFRRLLRHPAHEVVAEVNSRQDAGVFWDTVERVLRRRARGLRSLA